MKILMISSTFPYPPTKGGTQVRTFHLMKYLSENHQVTLVTQRSEDVTNEEIARLGEFVRELKVFPRPTDSESKQGILGKAKRFGQFIQQGIPPSVRSSYSQVMQAWIDEAVATGNFAAITSEHSVNEIYVRPEWQTKLRAVVNIHSSVYGTCKHQLETQTSENKMRDNLNLPLLRRYEQHYCEKFSAIAATTEVDKRQLKVLNPDAQISVIPNGVDLNLFPMRSQDPGGRQLVFIGAMDNAPNIDAVRFFSLSVFPEIRKRYPDASLDLVGARPVAEVEELNTIDGITVTGRVPSMVDYLHQATICIVPMRTGFGIKNKTLEAMAAGIPVVGSDRGLEGLAVDGADVPLRAMRANDLEEYIYSISRLFDEPALRKKLSQNARSLIEKQYTWERAGSRYEQLVCDS
ncbi:MAG: glycosyltransferase [Kamptonema sp. SIO1D9]|nr:glycosyltransferase [Kamptonema sp. SIO1D9]